MYARATDEVVARTRRPSENDVHAAAHVRISRRLYHEGAGEAAKQHLEKAIRLCPDKETHRRQSRVLEPDLVSSVDVPPQYFEAENTCDGSTFYPTVNMPGVIGPPGLAERRQAVTNVSSRIKRQSRGSPPGPARRTHATYPPTYWFVRNGPRSTSKTFPQWTYERRLLPLVPPLA